MKKFSEMTYARPDMAEFKKEFKACLSEFKHAKSYEEARAAYLKSDEISSKLETVATLAHVRNTMDNSDEFYDAEMKFFNSAIPKLTPLIQSASKLIVKSPYRKDFDAEFGTMLIKDIEEKLRTMSARIIPEMIKENNLQQEYSKITAACKVDFRGEECNFYGLLKHMQSTDRAERKEAFKAWAKLYEDIATSLDGILAQLIALRTRMAKKLKFNSYTELAYINRGRYDYDASDAARFREQVKEHIVPACAKIMELQRARLNVDKLEYFDEQLVFPEGNAVPVPDMEGMVKAAEQMYCELSQETGEFFKFMTEYELFDLATRPNKRLGGYCTFISDHKAPFIFSNFNGTSADVDVLTHEAGHAFEAYTASRLQPVSSYIFSTSEVDEIHSMTMEHFTYPWMDKFFGENADKYRYAHLVSAFTVIPYLVSVDEFQHRIYEKPDMDAAQRRHVWRGIEKTYMPWRSYEGSEFMEDGGFWMQKQHIFLYPFYYIDYALAQICAFELYSRMKTDREKAWNDYMTLCRAGGSKGYFELLELASLHNPFEPGSVETAVKGVIEEIEAARF